MCLFPQQVYVTHKESGLKEQIIAGCGKCSECLRQRTNNWRARLMLEASNQNCHCFMVTFTYSNESIPKVKGELVKTDYFMTDYDKKNSFVYYHHRDIKTSVNNVEFPIPYKKDIQNFNKRLRIYFDRQHYDLQYKYFIVAEYGSKTFRPHYHGLFFVYGLDWKKFTKENVLNAWNNGFIDLSLCRDSVKSANYVAGYVSINKNHPYEFNKIDYINNYQSHSEFTPKQFNRSSLDCVRYNTFYLFSLKLGKTYYQKYWEERIKNNLDILIKANPKLQKLINILSIGKQIDVFKNESLPHAYFSTSYNNCNSINGDSYCILCHCCCKIVQPLFQKSK